MLEKTDIRKVTPANFANWLEKHTAMLPYRHFPTERGRMILGRSRTQGLIIDRPDCVVITGTYVYPDRDDPTRENSTKDTEQIRFSLIPLDSECTEITARCSETVPVLAYFENELMPEIERRWPAEGNEQSKGGRGNVQDVQTAASSASGEQTKLITTLLQRIYDHFVVHGEWPLYTDIEIEMHSLAPLYQIITGNESLLLYQRPINESSVCFLTLKGIEKCNGSERDIQNFLRATDLFARRYIRDRATATINNYDLVSELGMSEGEAHRTCKLILQDGEVLWGSASSSNDGRRHEFHVSRRVLYFDGVSTLEDFFEREARAREAEKSEAGIAFRPIRAHDTRPTDHPAMLRQNIAEHFNLDELRTLCFDMGIKHENLAADTIDSMARELVAYCERTGRILDLVARCKELRPHVAWEDKLD